MVVQASSVVSPKVFLTLKSEMTGKQKGESSSHCKVAGDSFEDGEGGNEVRPPIR